MGKARHESATTTHAARAAIQRSIAGQRVERMNRAIKDATVKRYHYDSHDPVAHGPRRLHLASRPTVHWTVVLSLLTYNFARRLKTLSAITLYEYIGKIWTSEPDSFIIDPTHQMPGLNT